MKNENVSYSPTKAFADGVNAAFPLIEAPAFDSAAWNCVSGAAVKEYFEKSPFATITAHERGFVVENIVTGGKYPVATWSEAVILRIALVERYKTISAGCRY